MNYRALEWGRAPGFQGGLCPLWDRLTRRLHGGVEAGRPARYPPRVSASPLRGNTGTEPPSGGNTPNTWKTPAEAQGRRKLCGRAATGSQWRLQAGRSRIPEAQRLCGWDASDQSTWGGALPEPGSREPIGKMRGWCIIPRAMGIDRGPAA